MGLQEKLKELEDELARTQKNKATEYHIGIVKSKIAQIRRELLSPRKHGASAGGFDVKKSGDATVALIGLPSVGKSSLLNVITDAKSLTAAYAFTTLKCIPGILEHNGARIQVLDLPGIIEGAKEGKGRGREIISVARNSDLILILIEATNPKQVEVIENELHGFGIRINTYPPNVSISRKARGGVVINHTVPLTKLTERGVMAVLNSYSIYNADVIIRDDITVDQFIDVIEGNRAYIPALYVMTKSDLIPKLPKLRFDYIPISMADKRSTDKLKDEIFTTLDLIRIYTKRKSEKADMEEPMIVRRGISVGEMCERLHRDLRKDFRYALVWGSSVKHQPQRVGIDHRLDDGDIVQIIKR